MPLYVLLDRNVHSVLMYPTGLKSGKICNFAQRNSRLQLVNGVAVISGEINYNVGKLHNITSYVTFHLESPHVF